MGHLGAGMDPGVSKPPPEAWNCYQIAAEAYRKVIALSLADEKFAARAPEAVVAKERAQLVELEERLAFLAAIRMFSSVIPLLSTSRMRWLPASGARETVSVPLS